MTRNLIEETRTTKNYYLAKLSILTVAATLLSGIMYASLTPAFASTAPQQNCASIGGQGADGGAGGNSGDSSGGSSGSGGNAGAGGDGGAGPGGGSGGAGGNGGDSGNGGQGTSSGGSGGEGGKGGDAETNCVIKDRGHRWW
jgi:hypothetical protein